MIGELIALGIFLLTELILAVWWASKIDTQVKAQWRIIDDLGKHFIKLPELVVKVDTMWIFQMRRGVSEVVDKGIGERNSPLKFNEEARAKLDPIKDELIKYYSEHKIMDDYEMLLLIEEKFGEKLLNIVCIPCGLSHGSCLLLALSVAKQSSILEFFEKR